MNCCIIPSSDLCLPVQNLFVIQKFVIHLIISVSGSATEVHQSDWGRLVVKVGGGGVHGADGGRLGEVPPLPGAVHDGLEVVADFAAALRPPVQPIDEDGRAQLGLETSRLFAGLLLGLAPRAARRQPELGRDVVALADAARRELEPVGEDAAALVARVVCQQSMQSVLLFATAPVPAEHLLVLVPETRTKIISIRSVYIF